MVADIECLVTKVIKDGFGEKTRIHEAIEIIINHIKEFEAIGSHEKFEAVTLYSALYSGGVTLGLT